jgi:hypothetical protein
MHEITNHLILRGLPRACLFWKDMVLYAYDGINFVLSKSSSSSPASSPSDPSSESGPTGNTRSWSIGALGVSPSFGASKESNVAQTCHLAARHVTDCALCVIFVALLNNIKSPVRRVMEHSCTETIKPLHVLGPDWRDHSKLENSIRGIRRRYRKFSSFVYIKFRVVFGCDEQRSELAPCDKDQGPQYERAGAMAYDP